MSAVLYLKMQKVGKTNIKGKKKTPGKTKPVVQYYSSVNHIHTDNQTVGQTK